MGKEEKCGFIWKIREKRVTFAQKNELMLKQIVSPQDAARLKKILEESRNVVIICHTSPDGDAIGSSLGLYEYLKRKGKQVSVVVPNYFPDFLHWMKDADKIVMFERHKAQAYTLFKMADLICCLDFNDLRRLEEMGTAVARQRCKRILIDHHLNPDKSKFCFAVSRPELSSTSELVFRLLDAMGCGGFVCRHGYGHGLLLVQQQRPRLLRHRQRTAAQGHRQGSHQPQDSEQLFG